MVLGEDFWGGMGELADNFLGIRNILNRVEDKYGFRAKFLHSYWVMDGVLMIDGGGETKNPFWEDFS